MCSKEMNRLGNQPAFLNGSKNSINADLCQQARQPYLPLDKWQDNLLYLRWQRPAPDKNRRSLCERNLWRSLEFCYNHRHGDKCILKGESNMSRKRILFIALAFSVLMVVFFFRLPLMQWIADGIMKYGEEKSALPESGAYYSEELDAELIFSSDGIRLLHDQRDYTVWVDHDCCFRAFLDNETVFRAHYQWDKNSDTMYITLEVFPGSYDAGGKYRFYRIS